MATRKPPSAAQSGAPAMPELNRAIATIGDGRDITRGYTGPLLIPTDSVLRLRGQNNLTLYESVYSDPQVKSLFGQRQLAVVQRKWRVEPASDAAIDVAAADALEQNLYRIGWDRVTSLMLFGVFYGYAVAELVYGREGGRVVIDKCLVRNRRRFRFDPEGGLRLLTPTDMLEGEPAEPPYFWHYATGADNDDEPYGQGLGHWLYWPTLFKRQGVRFWLTFLDKFGSPTRVGKYDAQTTTDADQARLLAAAYAMGSDSAVILPNDMVIEMVEAARSGAADYKSLHDTMDATMARVVLGQTASSQGTPGRLGNDELQGDVREDLIGADSDLVCESFNRGPARWLTAWNFPGAQPPRVYREIDKAEDLKSRAERDEIVSRISGYKPTLKYVQETYGGDWEEAPLANLAAPATTFAASPAPTATFSARRADPSLAPVIVAQSRLDRAVDALPADTLDAAMEAIVGPVVAALRRGESHEQAAELLLEAVPDMDDAQMAELLARAVFVADLWGQVAGNGGA